jgi:DNA-3-methyladenine glycosylase
VTVAKDLVGCRLVSGKGSRRTVARIVEVEAYLGAKDPASHAYRYRRHRQNESLFGPPGTWYVYLSYGVHWCANLVVGPTGEGAAVLLRALEPLEGTALMRRRRGPVPDRALCAGPGRLTQAMAIDRGLDGIPMRDSWVQVFADGALAPETIAATPRIGITQAADWPFRFVVRASPWASGRRVP